MKQEAIPETPLPKKIMVCVYESEFLEKVDRNNIFTAFKDLPFWRTLRKIKKGTFVDYEGKPSEFSIRNITSIGWLSEFSHGAHLWLFSPADSTDKYSKRYFDCVGIVLTGIKNGKRISLLAHLDPSVVTGDPRTGEKPPHALVLHATHLLQREFANFLGSVDDPSTIDAVMFAGANDRDGAFFDDFIKDQYRNVTGMEMHRIDRGTNVFSHAQHAFFENNQARLYFARPGQEIL